MPETPDGREIVVPRKPHPSPTKAGNPSQTKYKHGTSPTCRRYAPYSLPPLASSYSLPQLFRALLLTFVDTCRTPSTLPPPPRVNDVIAAARSLPRPPSPIRSCYAAATPRSPAEHVRSPFSASPSLLSHLSPPSASSLLLYRLSAHDRKTDAASARCGSASCTDSKGLILTVAPRPLFHAPSSALLWVINHAAYILPPF
ncbi:hypothetical protein C8J57DRAFT_1542612 [Mycena rebaudengoi]|nr:hypothetical protein C8J57DRAFT_1542612 [Mycena rebaudengoi]